MRCAAVRTVRGAALAVVIAGALATGACSSGDTAAPAAPASATPTTGVDPAVAPYCDAVLHVQAEQSAPGAGQNGVPASADAARQQVAALVATSPPEIAGDWRTVAGLTDQALNSLAATGGDPSRIDPAELARLQQQAQPSITRIQDVTQQRCGITFRLPG